MKLLANLSANAFTNEKLWPHLWLDNAAVSSGELAAQQPPRTTAKFEAMPSPRCLSTHCPPALA